MDDTQQPLQDINTVAESILSEGTAPRMQGDERRRSLIQAAYHLIAEGGFEGLRTRNVAARAGVNIATLHYYFPTKEALIRGVIGYAMQRFNDTLPRQGSPVDQLRGHFRALATLMKTDHQLWAVLGELVLRAPRDADLAQIFRHSDRVWHRTMRDLIQRCIDQGAIDPDINTEEITTLIVAAIRGVSLPTVSGFEPELADRVFRQLERLLGLPAIERN